MASSVYGNITEGPVKIMGILNLTPDSFYDGGKYYNLESALNRAKQIEEDGAHIIDIGAESTRPGSIYITADEEIERLRPVLNELTGKCKIPISLDTNKPAVARFFLQRGFVHMINDVTGLRDPDMINVVKEYNVPAIMMHMIGDPKTMQQKYEYDDVVNDIVAFFQRQIDKADYDKLILDPGIGFGKSVTHNLEIVRRFKEFKKLGFPLMIGASRKSFIGKILEEDVGERLEGSLGVLAIAVMNEASMVRVHDVRESVKIIKMVEAIKHVTYKEIQV